MQTASFRIWIRVAESIPEDDNRNVTSASRSGKGIYELLNKKN